MSDDSMQIRPASPDDLAELVCLEKACFAVPWSEESLRYDLCENKKAHYLVAAAADGTLAGYAAYWQVMDEAQITNIAVAPKWRRMGIGRRLVLTLISQAKESGLVLLLLEARISNLPAIKLYESVGFKSVALRRGYYSDNGEDAIIMLKNIN